MIEPYASESELQELKSRSTHLAKSVSDYLGARLAEVSLMQTRIENQKIAAEASRQRKISIARNKASQLLIEHSSKIQESVTDLLRSSDNNALDMLTVSEYLEVGTFRLQPTDRHAEERASNLPVKIPAIVPFLNHGNLIIRHSGKRDTVAALLSTLVLDALVHTSPGQLIVHYYDPHLRGANAPFVTLRNARAELLPEPRVNSDELRMLFDDLYRDVTRIAEYTRGRDVTLADLREECRQPIESYQLIVIRDFPSGIDEQLYSGLLRLMESGTKCGISICIDFDKNVALPNFMTMPKASNHVSTVDLDDNILEPFDSSGLVFVPRQALEIDDLLQEVTAVRRAIDRSRLSSIRFSEVHDGIDLWSRSSDDGITAIIGKSGVDSLTITLGEERSQRHNVLVSGAVGQGKSNLLMALVHSVAWQYSPDEVEMYLLDLKEGLTLGALAPHPPDDLSFLPHAKILGLQSDQAFGCAILGELTSEFNRRARVMRPYGDNITRYRQAVPNEKMPRILVVIDEFHKLFAGEDSWADLALEHLVRLAREGRAYGIHLVLASQTLSGITALLAQQDGIFAQFPIRLALKNSLTESQVVLGPGNNDAARLRFRGEIIVNEETGLLEANRRGLILDADPSDMAELRTTLWMAHKTAEPPTVFDGAVPATLAQHLHELRALREASSSASSQRTAVVGTSLSIVPELIGAQLSINAGSHLAVIGAASVHGAPKDGRAGSHSESASPNLALGALLSAAIALGMQHPVKHPEFVFLDLLDPGERDRCNLRQLIDVLFHFGASVDVVTRQDVNEYINSLARIMDDRTPDHTPLYIVGLGFDRVNLQKTDPISAESSAHRMRQILTLGPQVRVHLLAWWASMASFNSVLGFEAVGEISNVLILGVNQSDLTGLMGPFVRWKFTPNRGLFHFSGLGEPNVIVPMAPPSLAELRQLREYVWD